MISSKFFTICGSGLYIHGDVLDFNQPTGNYVAQVQLIDLTNGEIVDTENHTVYAQPCECIVPTTTTTTTTTTSTTTTTTTLAPTTTTTTTTTTIAPSAWVQRGTTINTQDTAYSISLSKSGNVLAIGFPYSEDTVRVYSWNGSAWVRRGRDIDGPNNSLTFGWSVSLNSNGDILAIGDREAGNARVYYWNGSSWIQRGATIEGEELFDKSGTSVSLNNDGSVLAIGSPNDGDIGYVKVYYWNGSDWIQRGNKIIDAQYLNDLYGYSVSLNRDGNILAIGSPGWSGGGFNNRGAVSVCLWDGSSWIKQSPVVGIGSGGGSQYGCSVSLNGDGNILSIGIVGDYCTEFLFFDGSLWSKRATILSSVGGDGSGFSVSINDSGNIVAIGAPYNFSGFTQSGTARVYTLNEWNPIQRGSDINGTGITHQNGWSVSLNGNGNVLAVLAFNPGVFGGGSYVKVYTWVGSS